jgi:hypothetical protein
LHEAVSLDCGVGHVVETLDRRTFLRAAGVCIGLPLLDAILPAVKTSAELMGGLQVCKKSASFNLQSAIGIPYGQ